MRTAAPLFLMTVSTFALVASSAHAEIAWRDNLRTAHAEAEAEGKQLLLHFYTDNCSWCEKLEAGAFQSRQVHESVQQHVVPVKVHAEENPKLTEMFSVQKFPTDVIVTVQGETLSHSVSPQDPSSYVAMLDAAGTTPATNEPDSERVANQTAAPATSGNADAAPQPQPAEPQPHAGLASPEATAGMPQQRTNEFVLPAGKPGQATNQLASSGSQERDLPGPAAPAAELPNDDAPRFEPQKRESEVPELAIQGFCPVSVIEEDRWVEGNPDFGVIHLGMLYLFGSAEKMQTFLDDPIPYTPVMNEIDVVRFFEERRIVRGKREWGLKDPVHQRMFFFADESAMNHFWNKHERYTEAAVEVMDEAIQDANPGS